jgi:Ras family
LHITGALGSGFYRGASGALLVYDVTSSQSVKQITLWRDELLERLDDAARTSFPIVVLANKLDLLPPEPGTSSLSTPAAAATAAGAAAAATAAQQQLTASGRASTAVDRTAVAAWCAELGMGHLETSAKDGLGVAPAMECVALLAMEEKLKQDRLAAEAAAAASTAAAAAVAAARGSGSSAGIAAAAGTSKPLKLTAQRKSEKRAADSGAAGVCCA